MAIGKDAAGLGGMIPRWQTPPRDPRDRPRIAVVFQGDPTDPTIWSGIPAGISTGASPPPAPTPIPVDARYPRAPRWLARALRAWTGSARSPTRPRRHRRRGAAADARDPAAPAPSRGALTIGQRLLPCRRARCRPRPYGRHDPLAQAAGPARQRSTKPARRGAGTAAWREQQRHNYERARACCVASEWAATLGPRGTTGSTRPRSTWVGFRGANSGEAGGGAATGASRASSSSAWTGSASREMRWSRPSPASAEPPSRRRPSDLIGPPSADLGPGRQRPRPSSPLDFRRRPPRAPRRRSWPSAHPANGPLPSSFRAVSGSPTVDAGASGVPSIGTTSGGGRGPAIGDGRRRRRPRRSGGSAGGDARPLCDPRIPPVALGRSRPSPTRPGTDLERG